jgi:hypothetical protein
VIKVIPEIEIIGEMSGIIRKIIATVTMRILGLEMREELMVATTVIMRIGV